MSTERFRQAERVFAEAIGRPKAERESWVAACCAGDDALRDEVLALLATAGDTAGPLDAPPAALSAAGMLAHHDPLIPAGGTIAGYRVLRVLGTGGMGVVYEAQQQRPRRNVALKVIRPGLASPAILRRFEFEAEMLGRLQHPGIAQIIEAGTFDSGLGAQPYFALELVDGRNLIEYVDVNHADPRTRLELLLKICDAVEHAHQRGVIHRDLKPANILVNAEGQPKVLDFGVARAAAGDGVPDQRLTIAETGERPLIGTLAYMSPEQVEGRPDGIDTRTDVYALGVILYQLVAGRLPHDLSARSLPDAVRTVLETDAPDLGRLTPAARGDLATIAGKAMEKDRARRYQSAAALADDLRRFIAHQPILARPPSSLYQFGKFTRRHRAGVAAASAALLAISGGLVAATIGFQRAATDRDAARAALTKQKQTADLLKDMLNGIDPDVARGRDNFVVRRMLDQWAGRLDTELKGQPDTEIEFRLIVGETYRKLSQFDRAAAMFNAAAETSRTTWGEESAAFADSIHALGVVTMWKGQYSSAESLLRRALAQRERLFGVESAQAAESAQNLGSALRKQGQYDEAEAMLGRAAGITERRFGPESRQAIGALNDLAMVWVNMGRLGEAESMQRRAIAGARKTLGDDHPETIRMLQNLGIIQYRAERYEDSVRTHREAMAMAERVLPGDSVLAADGLDSITNSLLAKGDFAEGRATLLKSLEMKTRLFGPESLDVAQSHYNIGAALFNSGDRGVAAEHAEKAAEIARRVAPESPEFRDTLYLLAQIRRAAGDSEGTEPILKELLTLERAASSPTSFDLAMTISSLGTLVLELAWKSAESDPVVAQQRAADALALLREAHGIFLAQFSPEHWRVQIARVNLEAARAADALLASRPSPANALTTLSEALLEASARFEQLNAVIGTMPAGSRGRIVASAAKHIAAIERALEQAEPGARHAEVALQWDARAAEIARSHAPK